MEQLLRGYLEPMIKANIDYLVLGCTHYTYLIPILKKLLPEHVKIIDSGQAVAKQTKHLLSKHELETEAKTTGKVSLKTNGAVEILANLTRHRYEVLKEDF